MALQAIVSELNYGIEDINEALDWLRQKDLADKSKEGGTAKYQIKV
jgi:hypothetical protein